MRRFLATPVLALAVALLAPAAASATDCGIPGAADASFTNTAIDAQGDIASGRTGGYLQLPFTVPAGLVV